MNATLTAGRTTSRSRAVQVKSTGAAGVSPLLFTGVAAGRQADRVVSREQVLPARRELADYHRRQARAVAAGQARSATRHFVLLAAALFASGYAAYLTLLNG